MDFAHYQSPKLLGSSITQVSIFGALSISSQIHRENQRENCGNWPIYLGRSAKSKSPDRLGLSRDMKTSLQSDVYGKRPTANVRFLILENMHLESVNNNCYTQN